MTMPILIVNFVIMGMVEIMDVTFMAGKHSKVFCKLGVQMERPY